jgi:CheY-like chemotaxis protein
MMPLIGGVELCRTLKADPATAHIPIVLMSAAHARASAGAGADAVIGKPFDLDVLDGLVERLLGSAEPHAAP